MEIDKEDEFSERCCSYNFEAERHVLNRPCQSKLA